jgi:phosphoribosylformylglycinamidine synthase I
MTKVKVLILRAPGTNCDQEMAFAFEQAGAQTELIYIGQLLHGQKKIKDYQILAFPGGFSYGDDLGAGKVMAGEMRLALGEDIDSFVGGGGLIIGVCNGFQILAKLGILPFGIVSEKPSLTLAANDSGKFECRWVHLKINPQSNCVFTQGIEKLYLPIAHAEGKLITEEGIKDKLNCTAYYVNEQGDSAPYPYNPNGSHKDIAGISDDSGRVFGLMPHPERHIRKSQHPHWTRFEKDGWQNGAKIFSNATEWARRA